MSITFSLLVLLSLHACDARLLRNDSTSKQVDQPSNSIKENEVWNEGKANSLPLPLPDNGARDDIDEAKGEHIMRSVGWKLVPHKKGGQPQPGFNLDYLPPKTHPPVHN